MGAPGAAPSNAPAEPGAPQRAEVQEGGDEHVDQKDTETRAGDAAQSHEPGAGPAALETQRPPDDESQ
jgi:hypothetical protein